MQDCLFCKIIGGEIPAKKVYENAGVVAFLDIKPSNPGHLLIVPKKHYKNIFDLPLDAWLEMMKAAHFLAPVTKESVGADGINITMNNEPAAHQIIFHAHVHLIPRFHGDPHKPWAGTPYAEGEAEKVADAIKTRLNS